MITYTQRLLLLLPLAGSLSLLGCAGVTPANPNVRTPSIPDRAVDPIEAAQSRASLSPQAATRSTPQRATTPLDQPWEITLGGAGTSNRDFNAGGAQIATSVGYYLNDVVEVSVRQNLSYGDPGRGISGSWDGVTRAAIDLHLPLGKVVPYAGANLGYAYGDTLPETFIAGPEAGVKFYVKDDVFLQASAEYEFFFDKSDRLTDAFRDGQLLYGLSMGVRF